jgi:hypothetical protein
MKTFLIVIAVLVVLWLGVLTVDRNNVQLHQNNQDAKINEMDNRFETLDERYEMKEGFIQEDNPIDKTEDKMDQAEDKFDQKIEMPYENEKTNENTNLKKDDNEFPEPNNNEEIDLKPNPDIDRVPKLKNKNNNRALIEKDNTIVAFGNINDRLYRGEDKSVEAFKLKPIFEDEESIVAFKVQ